MRKLNSFGFAHHVLLITVVAVAVGGVGAMVLRQSNAATVGTVISGTVTNCGSAYNNWNVVNLKYGGALKNSDSVRNLAKYVCEKGSLDSPTALKINKSGTWSPKLGEAIKNYEASHPKLRAEADGKPDAKLVCALGEHSYVSQYPVPNGPTYHAYFLHPVGFTNNDCYNLMGTTKDPDNKG